MADAFLQLPLKQIVDLVINSPEEGIVNFSLLHTLLHVFVQQLNAEDLSVELHGQTAARLQSLLSNNDKALPSLNVTEIVVTDNKKTPKADKIEQKDQAVDTVLVVEPVKSTGGMAITKKQLDEIYYEMEEMKIKIQELTDLPANMGIIDAVRSESSSPVYDMLQLLNLSKRIDAAEAGMSKMASMVEDVIKNPIDNAQVTCIKPPPKNKASKKHSAASLTEPMDNEVVQKLVEDVDKLKLLVGMDDDDDTVKKHSLEELFRDVSELKDKFYGKKKPKEPVPEGEEPPVEEEPDDLPPNMQLMLLETKFGEMNEYLERLDQNFNDDLTKLHDQFTDIEKDFNEILSKLQGGMGGGDSDEPNKCCSAAVKKLVGLQEELENLTKTSAKLIEDKEDKQKKMDEMLEEIELLKTIKADREDMEEALADKADACAVHRKVSHDQFDSACDNLMKGIEDALEKLAQQETMWTQALDDISSEIGNKLDKMDLGPLREFINNKLKTLQDKMRSLAALKKEQEAAGTTNKLLKDVNCISCNKDVVMRKELNASLKPPPYALPPTRSMAPYLAYELDTLRKQQKGVPGSKNMNHLERAMEKGVKKGDDHICNRYCGGSHTVTTPQQRVTRLGHFLMQWGPDAIVPEPKKEEPKEEQKIVTKKASVIVQGDIVSSRKSLDEKVPSKSKQSKSSVAKAQKSSKESVDKKVSVVDAKKPSQSSVKSARSNKSTSSKEKQAPANIPEESPDEVAAAEEDGAEPAPAPEETEPQPPEEGGEAPPPAENETEVIEEAPVAEEPAPETPAE